MTAQPAGARRARPSRNDLTNHSKGFQRSPDKWWDYEVSDIEESDGGFEYEVPEGEATGTFSRVAVLDEPGPGLISWHGPANEEPPGDDDETYRVIYRCLRLRQRAKSGKVINVTRLDEIEADNPQLQPPAPFVLAVDVEHVQTDQNTRHVWLTADELDELIDMLELAKVATSDHEDDEDPETV